MTESPRAGLIQLAPAKLNLTLEVLGQRSDGFHEVRSVLQAIELWDTLYLELTPQGIDFHCSRPNLESGDNLVVRAAECLSSIAGGGGVSIGLNKGIPEGAGLGGGSSDAAATLRGLDWLWRLDLGQERLAYLASQLSADAPFFLTGGTALAEGKGEKITLLPPLPSHWAIILKPDLPIPPAKTAHLYGRLQPEHYTRGEHTDQLVSALMAQGVQSEISGLLFNVFEAVAFTAFPGLAGYRQRFRRAGAAGVHLAGSGPALFSLTPDGEKALRIHKNLEKGGLEVYLARTAKG